MPSDAVLRRKAQKKKKRRNYSRCSQCGGWVDIGLSLWISPRNYAAEIGSVLKYCKRCDVIEQLPKWTGVHG